MCLNWQIFSVFILVLFLCRILDCPLGLPLKPLQFGILFWRGREAVSWLEEALFIQGR